LNINRNTIPLWRIFFEDEAAKNKKQYGFLWQTTRKHSYALTRLPPIEGKGFCPMQPDKGAYFSLDPPFLHRQETALTRAK
jgi:hypothetical protein